MFPSPVLVKSFLMACSYQQACASAALEQGVSRFGMMAGDCYIDNNTPLSGAYPYVTESGLGEMTIDGIYGALDVYRVVDKGAC
jgi:hypothetical protein